MNQRKLIAVAGKSLAGLGVVWEIGIGTIDTLEKVEVVQEISTHIPVFFLSWKTPLLPFAIGCAMLLWLRSLSKVSAESTPSVQNVSALPQPITNTNTIDFKPVFNFGQDPAVPIESARPAPTNRLVVQSIVLGELRIGHPFTATVYLKNVSGKILRVKNIAFTQTRPFPQNVNEERTNEDTMWSAVETNILLLGRDAEFPTMGDGEFNQVLESNPVGRAEFQDIAQGNQAAYFAMLTLDRETGEHLVELCFFVGWRGAIHFCSTHNLP